MANGQNTASYDPLMYTFQAPEGCGSPGAFAHSLYVDVMG